eukprot:6509137-Pyramimonas_sp.AAC.1
MAMVANDALQLSAYPVPTSIILAEPWGLFPLMSMHVWSCGSIAVLLHWSTCAGRGFLRGGIEPILIFVVRTGL